MSQSLSQLWTHIIFSTKKRHPFLKDPKTRTQIYDYVAGICREQHCHAAIIGGIEDHVHLLVQLHKNVALSTLIEALKKSSSKWIKTFSDSNICDKFYWQKGYAAFSVSQSQIRVVQQYIENQQRHHQKMSFQEELRQFLIQHGVRYDEQYLWE